MCAIGYSICPVFRTSSGRASGHRGQRCAAAVPAVDPRRPMLIFVSPKKSTWRSNMPTINLKDFYPWYTTDEYIEVSEEVAEELLADKRYEKSYWRRVYYNKAQYSLDAGDGIENAAIPSNLSLDATMEYGLSICELCRALNSLPDVQGRRIDAHYILGKSYRQIADEEGVDESAVRASVKRGLQAMKKFLLTASGFCF